MSMIVSHIETNQTLNAVLSVDREGHIQIRNQAKALEVLLAFDANSVEYKVVQISMQHIVF